MTAMMLSLLEDTSFQPLDYVWEPIYTFRWRTWLIIDSGDGISELLLSSLLLSSCMSTCCQIRKEGSWNTILKPNGWEDQTWNDVFDGLNLLQETLWFCFNWAAATVHKLNCFILHSFFFLGLRGSAHWLWCQLVMHSRFNKVLADRVWLNKKAKA